MKINICPDKRGNELCTDGKHTYHEWNITHGDGCNFCHSKYFFSLRKCHICEEEIKENIYCECERCSNCKKIIKR